MKRERQKPQLLAPAGDFEKLKWAIMYGADAVYIGGYKYGLRANATNFTKEEIKKATKYAHKYGRKVYVTVNIIMHEEETKGILAYLKQLDNYDVDAIIVTDPLIIDLALKHTNLEVHLSTQQSTLNYEAISFWKDIGIKRIVMARETTKEELYEIKQRTNMDLEVFIHGAMCASISGRCVLSNFLTNRDANRGGCSQICRWAFQLKDKNGNLVSNDLDFTFCAKDLIMSEYIKEMMDIGITSFKIEGRMRSVYYIATVVNIYRKIIDEIWYNYESYQYNNEYDEILRRCANREVIEQFFVSDYNNNYQYYLKEEEVSNQDFLGIVKSYDFENKMVIVEQRNYFKKGDVVEIFGPNMKTIIINLGEIYDENNEIIEVVRHPKQVVKIRVEQEIEENSLVRKKIDNNKKL